jgi:TRAP-type C4-dicarboxylate transport system permease small subunit
MTGPLKRLCSRALGALCIVIFTGLVVVVLWGVITRYVLGDPASWSEEVARLCLVWLSMVGGALAYLENSHLGVDIVTRLLDPAARRFVAVLNHLLVLGFALAVMVYGGGSLFVERWQSGQIMSALPILKAWFYLSVPVSGALIAVFALDATIGTACGRPLPGSEPVPETAANPAPEK